MDFSWQCCLYLRDLNMSSKNVGILVYFYFLCEMCVDSRLLEKPRQKRGLIFPPTTPTRLQFICGIGIPVEDLSYESVTSGYVFKAEYFLPTNATELHKNYFKPQTIHRRRSIVVADRNNNNALYESGDKRYMKKNKNDLSTYRWTIYKAIEEVGNKLGINGRACILKTICEIASVPFHHTGGILAELAHIVMTPSSSVDFIHHHSNNEYLHAEMLGRLGSTCSYKFFECKHSLMETFSIVINSN